VRQPLSYAGTGRRPKSVPSTASELLDCLERIRLTGIVRAEEYDDRRPANADVELLEAADGDLLDAHALDPQANGTSSRLTSDTQDLVLPSRKDSTERLDDVRGESPATLASARLWPS